jgi:hypothetical protein
MESSDQPAHLKVGPRVGQHSGTEVSLVASVPEIGQLVQVRRRAFVVTDIQAQGLPTGEVLPQHFSHLVLSVVIR